MEERTLPIVMLENKSADFTHEEALYGAVYHMEHVHANYKNYDEKWVTTYEEWFKGKIRKVVRRSKPAKFKNLSEAPDAIHTIVELPHGRIIELVSIPPHPNDQRDERLNSMQVSGLELPSTGAIINPDSQLIIAVDKKLGASTGKLMAQVSHSIQLALMTNQKEEVYKAFENGFSLLPSFEELPESLTPIVEVRDAGFTEIPAGSITAILGIAI